MNQKVAYLQVQIEILKMHAMRAPAEIVSGHYKTRKIFHGYHDSEIELTDEEKLKYKVDEMKMHIHHMDECASNLYDALEQP